MQSSTGTLLGMWFGRFAVVLAVAIAGRAWLLAGASQNLQLAWFGVVVLGGMCLLYRLGKAVSAVPTGVSVAADRLTIYEPQSGEETQVLSAEIAAYRASRFNGAGALRLTLKDGRTLHVKINSRLYGGQNFGGLVAAFEAAVGHFQQAANPAAVVRRGHNFFEKPISTLVLALFTACLAWARWVQVTGPNPVKANLFMVVSSYIAYFASWHAARERRAQWDDQKGAVP